MAVFLTGPRSNTSAIKTLVLIVTTSEFFNLCACQIFFASSATRYGPVTLIPQVNAFCSPYPVKSYIHEAQTSISSFSLGKSPSSTRLPALMMSGSISLENSRISPSYLMEICVSLSMRSKFHLNYSGRGPDTVFHATIWFSSYSVTSYSDSSVG